VKGILADVNIQGYVDQIVTALQAEPWKEFWADLQLKYARFADVGLPPTAADSVVWHTCQQHQLVLITDNRNLNDADSLEATIRAHNTVDSLPVFTIGDIQHLHRSRVYADRVIEALLDALERIGSLRGTGRLYLP
jgi:hypothetical protein